MTMDKIGNVATQCMEFGLLAALSIQRTRPGVTPAAPSNEERAHAFRNAQPVALANNFDWRFRREVGGRQAVARLLAANGLKQAASRRWLAPLLD